MVNEDEEVQYSSLLKEQMMILRRQQEAYKHTQGKCI